MNRIHLFDWMNMDKWSKVLIIEPCLDITKAIEHKVDKVDTVELDQLFCVSKNNVYDGIICMEFLEEKQLSFMRELLGEHGILVWYCNNALAMRFWAGASNPDTGDAFGILNKREAEKLKMYTKNEIVDILNRSGFTNNFFYYPMNTAENPTSIYSDLYLPKPGDIRNEDLDSCENAYRTFDEGIAFDRVINDGLFSHFANGYLVLASNSEINTNIVYCKNNTSRNVKYQTQTCMINKGGEKWIEKYPLTYAASSHIAAFDRKYESIKNLYPQIDVLKVGKIDAGVKYNFIPGESLDDYLMEKAKNIDEFLALVKEYIAKLYVANDSNKVAFEMSDEFKTLFGEVDCTGMNSLCPCNIDMVFDNLMIDAKEDVSKITLFDYEWVYDISIPEKYVVYRVICRLYDKYFAEFSGVYSFEDVVYMMEFTEEENTLFRKMEDAFISHVYEGTTSGNQLFHRRTLDEIEYEHKLLKETQELLHKTENELIQNIEKYNELVNQLNAGSKVRFLAKKTVASLKQNGVKGTVWKIYNKLQKSTSVPVSIEIQKELLKVIEVSDKELNRQKNVKFEVNPKISIITPLFNTPHDFLIDLFESVISQTYSNWEFCVVNFSTDKFDEVDKSCREYSEKDERISYHIASENRGISENTNVCISYATGEYIALLDHDDMLHPCALYEVVKAINDTGADFIYTDETKFDTDIKNVYAPNFKPDFTAEELRVHNYVCHFNVYSRELFDSVGGYRSEFDGSQDHDIVLRLTAKAGKIIHVPKILYYWRVHANSVAQNINAKSYATRSGENAVTEQFDNLGIKCEAKSIMNNIPCYRFWPQSKFDIKSVAEDVTVVLWGDDALAKKDELNDWNVLITNDFKQVMEQINTKWVWLLNSECKIDEKSALYELAVWKQLENIASIDSMAFSKEYIISGGCYKIGKSSNNIGVRCAKRPMDYSGYESAMIHNRPVVAAAGFSTFINVDLYRLTEGFEAGCSFEAIIRYTYKCFKKGWRNIFSPFMPARDVSEKCETLFRDELDNISVNDSITDPFNSIYIDQIKLE